jgi:hypothetical protein
MKAIDVSFCVKNPRNMSLTNETRLGMTKEEVDNYSEKLKGEDKKFNFTTEVMNLMNCFK